MTARLSLLTSITAAALVAASVGCQSSGGSRWARLNPWSSKPAETALAENAPTLPSAETTPKVEGLAAPATAVAGNPAAAEAPAFAAAAPEITKTPSIGTPVSVPISPYSAPPTTVAATPAPPAGAPGPYDPDAYRSNDPVAAVAAKLRAAATQVEQTSNELGSRYGDAVATTPTVDVPDFSLATAPAAPASVGDRYGAMVAQATQPAQDAIAQFTPSAATTSAPTAPAAPATPTRSLPTATAETVATTAAPRAYPVAAAPITPAATGIVPASGEIASVDSRVQLTSAPGEYRPGGTSSYLGSVSVASRTTETKPAPPANASPYPTTGQQYR